MKYIKNIIKGFVIGVATIVPGVSGGTMAVILNVYDDLIHSVSSFFEDWRKHSLLLAELGIGAFAALLLFSKLLEKVIAAEPYIMRFLFIGIICGGIPVLYKKSKATEKKSSDIVFLFIGFIIVLLLGRETSATATLATSQGLLSIFFLFFAGIVIAVALILPGISASFMLLAIGLYSETLSAINEVNIPFLIPLLLGVLVGTLATAKTIEKLLQKHPSKTYLLILGFVIGSLIPVFPGIPTGLNILTSLLAFIMGFIIIYWIGKKESN